MTNYDGLGNPINADEGRTRNSVVAELIVSGYVTLTYSEVDKLDNDELIILYAAIREAEVNAEWKNRKDSKDVCTNGEV